jgi:segregation and condensation protein B
MTDLQETISLHSIEAALEAVLFVAAGPVALAQLVETLAVPLPTIELALNSLSTHLADGHGIRLQRHEGQVQLTTAPELAGVVERFWGIEATARLSRAGLETLAIVAYRQPITRPGVDAIRGVNSDGVMKSLLAKGLIQEIGRAEGPGRPILYGTTAEFLQYFGLSSLRDLPPFDVENEQKPENGLLKD